MFSLSSQPWRHFVKQFQGVVHVGGCSSCWSAGLCALLRESSHRGSWELQTLALVVSVSVPCDGYALLCRPTDGGFQAFARSLPAIFELGCAVGWKQGRLRAMAAGASLSEGAAGGAGEAAGESRRGSAIEVKRRVIDACG